MLKHTEVDLNSNHIIYFRYTFWQVSHTLWVSASSPIKWVHNNQSQVYSKDLLR